MKNLLYEIGGFLIAFIYITFKLSFYVLIGILGLMVFSLLK